MRRMLPGLIALAAAMAFGVWALGRLPAEVISHWGVEGRPDGWSSRNTIVFLIPLAGLAVALLFTVFPRIDPRRANYELHAGTYWTLANATLIAFAAMHALVIGINLGWPVSINRVMGLGVGGLFILIGNLMSRMRPNWFMGIRTPWTLSSDSVWRKTHRLGGYAFVIAGVILIGMGFARPAWLVLTLFGAAALAGIVPVIYSYILWREEQREKSERAISSP